MSEKIFYIKEKDLKNLIESDIILNALECGGVDNWEWSSEACSNYLDDCYHEEREANPDFDFSDAAEMALEGYEEVK